MKEQAFEIEELVLKFLRRELSTEEEEALDAWRNESAKNQLLFEELTNDALLTSDLRTFQSFDKKKGLRKLHERIGNGKVRRMGSWRWVAAASIILVLGVGGYLLFFNKSKVEGPQVTVAKTNDVPAPTGTKAMITLADGTKVYLDSVGNGVLAQQSGVSVMKSENGQIVYSHEDTKTQSELVYNTLTNPRGSKVINMTLSDGSHVWLNAGSSVTYPVTFVGNERKVEITGEAYFEVTHDAKKPFVVSKGETSVTVLGTHFNVNAYEDEESLKVTLLEGSVRVKSEVGGQKSEKIIKPGQQAKAVSGELSVVSNVDVDEVMAWKNGLFSFNNTDLKTVMRQIARWYDVDVEYQGNIPSKVFVGEIDRTVPVSKVLQMMEYVGVKFKIEGKKITVMQ